MQSWEKYTPQMLSILRIVTCLIFILHATQKLWGFPGPPASGKLPDAMTLSWFAAMIEITLGPLLLVGIFALVRLHSVGRDGIRLLDRTFSAQLLADPEPG